MFQNMYIVSLLLSLGINILFFLLAYLLKTDKFTDFTYGLTFIVIAIFFTIINQAFHPTQLLLDLMIIVWAVRLITYLLIRILKIKKDSRFDDKRGNLIKFLQFWLFQALAVWVIMLPSMFYFTRKNLTGVNLLVVPGFLIWIVGLLIETIADKQKFDFKNNLENKNLWIQSGLWKYSRHPNYFGEMLVWWGIFIYVIPTFSGRSWLTVIGPMFITFILVFVSGIPLLEKRYDKKFANNKNYQKYKKRTNTLIPLPKRE